ncbi:MAG: hypothetical protein JXA18_10280 [Chitinispirillaceae bacterium]|nr:hypothetical protein [Chitinispirillaceae bacterium]
MRMKIGVVSLIVAVAMAGCNCTNDPEGNRRSSPVGYWVLPITDLIPDTMNIILDINEDATFHLELNQRSEKVLFQSEGGWETRGDSIVLDGDECLILDTVPDPDTLAHLADSICKAPIPLNLPEEEKTWRIRTSSLALMLSAFPIDEEVIALFIALFSSIMLTKEGE